MTNSFAKKTTIAFSLLLLFLVLPFLKPQSANADAKKTLIITGVALGGTALAVAGYNAYRNRQVRQQYEDYGYRNTNNNGRYSSRRPCQNQRRYQNTSYGNQRYNNQGYPDYNDPYYY